MKEITKKVRNFLTEEDGQGLVEYSLILVLISIAAMAIMILLGTEIGVVFQKIIVALGGAEPA